MEEIKKVQSMLDAFIKSTTLTDKQKESMQLIVEELNSSNSKADEINKSKIEFETKFGTEDKRQELKYIVDKYNDEIVVSGAHLTELYEKYVESLKERGVIE